MLRTWLRGGAPISDHQRIAHFLSKLDRNGPIPSHAPQLGPCWIWTDHRKANGYGQFYVNRQPVYAHRFACELVHGPLGRRQARHKCDNGAGGCARPSHLEPGTARQNSRDQIERGRTATGDRNGSRTRPDRRGRGSDVRPKLTACEVREIRTAFAETGGERGICALLARQYSVNRSTIYDIVSGRSWHHVA